MSMHTSVIAIEGDHLHEIAEVLRACRYVIEKSFTTSNAEQASRELDWNPDRNHVAKIAYFSKGWTFIIDPELVLVSDDIWLTYSRKWKNRIVGWLCEGASGSYGLTVFNAGDKCREVAFGEGEVGINTGEPLLEESDMDWNEPWEDDVLKIAERLGAEYDFPADRTYVVYYLDESQMELP